MWRAVALNRSNRRAAKPVTKAALSRLPMLDIGELRRQWRALYKTQAPPAPQPRVARTSCRIPDAGTRVGRPPPSAAAPAPPDCKGVQGNWSGHDTGSPGAEARNPADPGMAGPNP